MIAAVGGMAVMVSAAPATAAAAAAATTAEAPRVAATVGGQPIRVAEVERVVQQLVKDRPAEPAARDRLRAETLEQLIDRQLVLAYLNRHHLGATPTEITRAVQQLEDRLGQQDVTLANYLKQGGIDRADLERRFAWELGWQRYLDRHQTDENLARYFAGHRRDFDGTEIRAAHILFPVKPTDDAAKLAEARRRAAALRQEIAAGRQTFEEAAEQSSQAPTAKWGGDVGFITRHKSMPEEFSKAAFALQAGEISQPVVTSFGVHLIKCVEVRPGAKRWNDVRPELLAATNRYLFQWIAERERPQAEIKYSDDVPHFQPGTKQLAK